MNLKIQGPIRFSFMVAVFGVRDYIRPPIEILRAAGVMPGQTVLDYGCGPGSFSVAAGQIVGPDGKVYAVDINPIALKAVRRLADRNGLKNLVALAPNIMEGLLPQTVDVALIYDVLHLLDAPTITVAALHRVIKPKGILAVSDHHMRQATIVSTISSGALFEALDTSRRYGNVYCFRRMNHD
jgi:ubiquinone/menaquinone biosynthesis C-methylase UbiE